MNQSDRRADRWKPTAGQLAQILWLAVAAFALCLVSLGFPYYIDLLQKACAGPDCFEAQLTPEAAQVWLASGRSLGQYAFLQTAALFVESGLVLSAAALLIWRKAPARVAVLAAFVGVALAINPFGQALAQVDPRFQPLAQIIQFTQMAGLLPILCLFPDGRFQPRALRWSVSLNGLVSFIYLTPLGPGRLASGESGRAAWLTYTLLGLAVVGATWFDRLRRTSSAAQREQLLWTVTGIGLAGLVVLIEMPVRRVLLSVGSLDAIWPDRYEPALYTAMFVAIGSFTCLLVGLLNYEPPDTDLLINRTLVYGALTAFIISSYALGVGAVGALLRIQGNILLSFLATALAAIAFNPVRERLHGAVNRLMYGERDEPYRVLTRLGQLLEIAVQPAAALPLAVATVAGALKLPYVAIQRAASPDQPELGEALLAEYRAPALRSLPARSMLFAFPLRYAGETIGALVVAPRALNEPFAEADDQVLTDLAQQISVALHAALLTSDLERARLRLVTAREEARRRLGSDLHDGVGHQLAGLARQAELATTLLGRDPGAARALVAEVTQQLNAAILQVRGLAHQLHPPELELLGLVGALRERAQLQAGFAVRIEAPAAWPPLPTAVETAAYYIALEALTNVEKHAGATICHIRFGLVNPTTGLEMEITDDGRGLPSETGRGLGLLSMQARAAEVGGVCLIEPNSPSGTRVSVRFARPVSVE